MNIVHICKSDIKGGAIKAAYRIHRYLSQHKITSLFYVDNKYSKDETVKTRFKSPLLSQRLAKYRLKLERFLFRKALRKNKKNCMFTINYFPGIKIEKKDLNSADIIQIHWIGNGTVSPERIKSFGKKVAWRLPDMYAFTGGCHYSMGCEKYTNQCGACPQLNSKDENDLSSQVFLRKKKAFENLDMTIITPSKWLYECAKKSSLFKNKNVVRIATGVETELFYPEDKPAARKALLDDTHSDKKIILFGAYSLQDERKGFHYLIEALKLLKESPIAEKIIVLTFGKKTDIDIDFPVYSMGFLDDFNTLRNVYNCADVYIVPSVEENLPNTGLEAMACGVPAVGFDIGGIPDMIDHKKNGYIAKPFSSQDLCNGIKWILENSKKEDLSKKALEKVLDEFEINKQTGKYIELYKNIST